MKKPISAWMLLLCYALSLCTAAFHFHECCHEHDSVVAEISRAGISESALPSFGGKLRLIHTFDSEELSSHHSCCAGLGDCDQAQLFSTSARVRGTWGLDVQAQGLFGLNPLPPDLEPAPARGRYLPPKFSPSFASLLSVRLLI